MRFVFILATLGCSVAPSQILNLGIPDGQAVPLGQVARLARLWYGSHGDPTWHKWTIAEAQDIFRKAGLDAPFWDLGAQAGRF
jgi:hypothetical protein